MGHTHAGGKAFRLAVRAQPKARRNAIAGWLGQRLKLAVTAAPEHGKANQAIERLLAQALRLPRSAVAVVAGRASRDKVVEIAGLTPAEARRRLAELAGPPGG